MRAHGTSRYSQPLDDPVNPGCRCDICREAWRLSNKRSRVRRARATRPAYTPTAVVLDHVNALVAQGLTIAQVCAAAGFGVSRVCDLRNHPRCTTRVADRFLAVTPAKALAAAQPTIHRANRMVLAVGTQRRITELNAMGWTMQQIADAAGLPVKSVKRISTGRRYVTERTFLAIRGAARDLMLRGAPEGPTAARCRTYAAHVGRVPLAAWDDDIDLPDATPSVTRREA